MEMGLKKIVLVFLFAFSATLDAEEIHYYGQDFYKSWGVPLSNNELKSKVFQILQNYHIPVRNDFDRIVTSCNNGNCYKHLQNSYKSAREELFGEIHLVDFGNGYAVEDVYCDALRSEDEFPSRPPGPGQIPLPSIVNAEHTWPQSLFSDEHPRSLQKSDLHSLYPVFSRVNSSRGNSPFGQVSEVTSQICPASKKGIGELSGRIVFEPPGNHKGNVARALFYFSVRYQMPLDSDQEETLRDWHEMDPVDDKELERNNMVFTFQKNRNPFIDHPELADFIDDF